MMSVRLEQEQNAPPLMEATLSGMLTLVRLVQTRNAFAPMPTIPSGMVTVCNSLLP